MSEVKNTMIWTFSWDLSSNSVRRSRDFHLKHVETKSKTLAMCPLIHMAKEPELKTGVFCSDPVHSATHLSPYPILPLLLLTST